MPERELHNYFCKKLLDRGFDSLNAFLDAPVKHKGGHHRVLFHDEKIIGRMTMFNVEAGIAAMLHKILDEDEDLQKVLRFLQTVERFGMR